MKTIEDYRKLKKENAELRRKLKDIKFMVKGIMNFLKNDYTKIGQRRLPLK